jgi:transglutaminase-like putative cysteine protease
VFFWSRTHLKPERIVYQEKLTIDASGQRVQPDSLRKVTWEELKSALSDSVLHAYSLPENLIQSNDPKIAEFVKQTLGAEYRRRLSPYDAARKLFLAVDARVRYTNPDMTGGVDKRGHSAIEVFDTRLADCGGYSMLLVALYRHIGFAARTAAGFWSGGKDYWHCWAELYFPGHDWVVTDGSGGSCTDPTGTYAFNFGANMDLNSRISVARGNTFRVGNAYEDWLQGPALVSSSGTAMPNAPFATSELAVAPPITPPIAVAPKAREIAPPHDCPCHLHGGWRPAKQASIR